MLLYDQRQATILHHVLTPCRMADLEILVEGSAGDCIEDMDMFHKALVLYTRSKGLPCIRVVPMPTGVPMTVQCCPAVQISGKV